MAKAMKTGIDFQLLDNGTAAATLTPLDGAGLEITVTATLPGGATISGTSEGIDVVGSAAAGFSIAL